MAKGISARKAIENHIEDIEREIQLKSAELKGLADKKGDFIKLLNSIPVDKRVKKNVGNKVD